MMSASARSGFLKAQPIGFKQLAGRQRRERKEDLLESREEIRAVHEKSQVDRRGVRN